MIEAFLLQNKEMINAIESIFFIFSVIIACTYVLSQKNQQYRRIKKDVLVQIKYFNLIHFIPQKQIFRTYEKKESLEAADLNKIDLDVELKTKLLQKSETMYQDLIKITDNLNIVKSYERSVFFLVVFLLLLVGLLELPKDPTLLTRDPVADQVKYKR